MDHFGVFNYSDQALANVLSIAATWADYDIIYDIRIDRFSVVISPTTSLHFVNSDGLYVCNMSKHACRVGVTAGSTVDENTSKYTKRVVT